MIRASRSASTTTTIVLLLVLLLPLYDVVTAFTLGPFFSWNHHDQHPLKKDILDVSGKTASPNVESSSTDSISNNTYNADTTNNTASSIPRTRGGLLKRFTGDGTPYKFPMKSINVPQRYIDVKLRKEDLKREDESPDVSFYTESRFVYHMDEPAVAALTQFYRLNIEKNSDILDLGASWVSHYPFEFPKVMGRISGVGINEKELRENDQLTDWFVRDLNSSDDLLPFKNDSFDVVTCSSSIQYFIKPDLLMKEVRRVLRPNGKIMISLTNRRFPSKTISTWLQMSNQEHLGLVSHYIESFCGGCEAKVFDLTAEDQNGNNKGDPLFVVIGESSSSKPWSSDHIEKNLMAFADELNNSSIFKVGNSNEIRTDNDVNENVNDTGSTEDKKSADIDNKLSKSSDLLIQSLPTSERSYVGAGTFESVIIKGVEAISSVFQQNETGEFPKDVIKNNGALKMPIVPDSLLLNFRKGDFTNLMEIGNPMFNSFFDSFEPKSSTRDMPTMKNWKQNPDLTISGFIFNSTLYDEGEPITTSAITEKAKPATIVTTESGSKYFLDQPIAAGLFSFDFLVSLDKFENDWVSFTSDPGSSFVDSFMDVLSQNDGEVESSQDQEDNEYTKSRVSSSSSRAHASQTLHSKPLSKTLPELKDWYLNENNSITGFVYGSDNFSEGEEVTTSTILGNDFAPGGTITTLSGSKYRLGLVSEPPAKNGVESNVSLHESGKSFFLIGGGSKKRTTPAPHGVPKLKSWYQTGEGRITGYIYGSADFEDGMEVTTSPIIRHTPSGLITTESGSRYFLDDDATTFEGDIVFKSDNDSLGSNDTVKQKDSKTDNDNAQFASVKKVGLSAAPEGVPTLKNWQLNNDRTISGSIWGSSAFLPGDEITTSAVEVFGTVLPGSVVKTTSGSKYFLDLSTQKKFTKEKTIIESRLDQFAKDLMNITAKHEKKYDSLQANNNNKVGENTSRKSTILKANDTIGPTPKVKLSSSIELFKFNEQISVGKDESSTKAPVKSAKILLSAPKDTPTIKNWVHNGDGSITGHIYGSSKFEDGEEISTSLVSGQVSGGTVVQTVSGSKYYLSVVKADSLPSLRFPLMFKKSKPPIELNDVDDAYTDANKTKTETFKVGGTVQLPGLRKNPLKLNGKSVGGGKYLLAGKAQRTTSRRSLIYVGYKTDKQKETIDEKKLIVKLSKNYESLERESRNYDRATHGLFKGSFVKKIEFLVHADGPGFDDFSALIIEMGQKDLKALLIERGSGLKGKALRDAALSAGKCIQALHSSNLVWTDLKSENFIVMSDAGLDDDDSKGLHGVRGIDVESAMPINDSPVDYSPEATPPEFASAFLKGEGPEFILKPSYDIWSYGMLLYELSTGRNYFGNASAYTVTETLGKAAFQADVSAIENTQLRRLVEKCLQTDPLKRPDITQVLLHPYFMSHLRF